MLCMICLMGDLSSIVLKLIVQRNHWRVEMVWPGHNPRYFGHFFPERKPKNGLRSIIGLLSKARSRMSNQAGIYSIKGGENAANGDVPVGASNGRSEMSA